jgi:hypothetical protein
MLQTIRKNQIIESANCFYKVLNVDPQSIRLNLLGTGHDFRFPYNEMRGKIENGTVRLLPPNKGLTVEAMKLIPTVQLATTLTSRELMSEYAKKLNAMAGAVPDIYQTKGNMDAKIALHYFYGTTDFYLMEYDGDDVFNGYMILNADRQNAGRVYQSRQKLFTTLPFLNLDYRFERVTIAEIKNQHGIKTKRSV